MFRLILAAIAIGVITYMIRRRLLQRLAAASAGAPPSALSYTSPVVVNEDAAITPLSPTVSGTAPITYTVDSLPTGLSIDSATGIISGTPTTPTASATYTVTATNAFGNTTFGVDITISDVFTPAELTGILAWYRADLGVTLDTGKVSVWADQSGNGKDAVQTVAGQRPTVTAAAVGGQDAITFSGSNRMTIAASLVSTAATLVAVYKNTSTAGSAGGYSCIISALGHFEAWAVAGDGNKDPCFIGPDAGTITGRGFDQADVNDLNAHILMCKWNGGDVTLNASYSGAMDRVTKTIAATGAFGQRTTSVIGDRGAIGLTMIGHIAELILVDAVTTAGEDTSLNTYLQARYGI